jgi:hypothetical protein
MIGRGYKSRVSPSSHLSHLAIADRPELAPGHPAIGTGCYGVIGPVPSTVLDKNKVLLKKIFEERNRAKMFLQYNKKKRVCQEA